MPFDNTMNRMLAHNYSGPYSNNSNVPGGAALPMGMLQMKPEQFFMPSNAGFSASSASANPNINNASQINAERASMVQPAQPPLLMPSRTEISKRRSSNLVYPEKVRLFTPSHTRISPNDPSSLGTDIKREVTAEPSNTLQAPPFKAPEASMTSSSSMAITSTSANLNITPAPSEAYKTVRFKHETPASMASKFGGKLANEPSKAAGTSKRGERLPNPSSQVNGTLSQPSASAVPTPTATERALFNGGLMVQKDHWLLDPTSLPEHWQLEDRDDDAVMSDGDNIDPIE
jgi:hypothetical protein